MPTIGPTGKFPLGKPMMSGDMGGINVAIHSTEKPHLLVMEFGKPVSWLGSPIAEMQTFATAIRQRVLDEFGSMPYFKAELPIRVELHKETGIIRLYLPRATTTLAANPEMWLALAEVIEDRIKEMASG